MNDGDALRRAIIADPDDDTARLVYADWLQENGRPERAEFIRAQIEAARAEPFSPKARDAAKRANALLEPRSKQWTQHLHGGFAEWPRFERGFVAHLSVEPTRFVPQADALFDAEPIQALKLYRFNTTTERHSFEPLFELSRLRALRRLELSSRVLDMEEFELVSSCKYLGGLRELAMRDNMIRPAWLSKVLTSDSFPELNGLDLAENTNLGPILSTALPQADHREIKRLNLSGVVFQNSEQLQRVLTGRCLRRVEELRLATVSVDGKEGPLFHLNLSFVLPWDRLVILDLAGQRLGNDGVKEITVRKEAAGLRWLGLASNHLGHDAVRYLVESKHLALNHLDVRGNELTLSERGALHKRFPNAEIVS